MPFSCGRVGRCVLATVVAACLGDRAIAAGAATTRPASAERVTIETEDGVFLIGDYRPPAPKAGEPSPMAILLHMEQSDRSAWKPLVPYLHAAGFAVLAIDLRGHGESVEPKGFGLARKAASRDSRLFRVMGKDVAAAYLWLVKQDHIDATRFVLVGAGVGCGVALDYAARDKSVDAIVCISPGLNYPGLDSAACIRKCDSRAIMLVAGKADGEAATELQRAATKATLKILPEAGSGTDLFGRAKDLEKTIATFVEHAVGRPAAEAVLASIESDIYHVPGTNHAQRIKEENRRWFSSPAEAEVRGLRPVKKRASKGTAGEARQASPKAPSVRSRKSPGN